MLIISNNKYIFNLKRLNIGYFKAVNISIQCFNKLVFLESNQLGMCLMRLHILTNVDASHLQRFSTYVISAQICGIYPHVLLFWSHTHR